MCIRDRDKTALKAALDRADATIAEGLDGYTQKSVQDFEEAYERAAFIYTPVSYTHLDVYKRQPFAFDGQVVFSVGNCRFAQQSMIMEPQSFCAYKLKDEMERRK